MTNDKDDAPGGRNTWRGQPDFASTVPEEAVVPGAPKVPTAATAPVFPTGATPSGPLHVQNEMPEHGVTATTLSPFVEVDLVHETGTASTAQAPWRALEIWTRNRIYGVDWNMICIEVIDRDTGALDPNHALLGAKLAGGQIREDGRVELSYPCPRPGCEAVFQPPHRKGGFAQTSTVLRVVLRLRILTVIPEQMANAWSDLTSRVSIANKPPQR